MDVRVLGPLEVTAGSGSLRLAAAKPRALLALLALHAGETVSADRLTDDLWQGRPPRAALHTLQVYASQLRAALRELGGGAEEVLVTRRPGYMLAIAPDELDARRFEGLAAAGRRALADGDEERAATLLGEALGEWRGPAYAEFAYERWAEVEAERLGELRAATVEARIEAELVLGRHGGLLAELAALVERYPTRERLRAQQMLALYRAGRQADALAAYRAARGVLAEELGIDPGTELQALERAILRHDPSLQVAAVPGRPAPVPAAAPARVQLPRPATPLVGREADVARIGELLGPDGPRLVTLTGPGGIGKTRLALAVAAGAAARFGGGTTFVELGSVADPGLVLPTIAGALGLEEASGGALECLAARLRDAPTLLVLDNLEHLLAAARDVADLLADAPALTVLATSRAPLHLTGEHVYRVPPLGLPDPSAPCADVLAADAVRLFLARVRAVRPDLVVDEASAAALAEICVRLDGLPLALELAAARARHLTPAALLVRLERRLTLLQDGPRDLPDRHRSLRATLDWSVALLEDGVRDAFVRASVFPGGFDLVSAGVIDPEADDADLLDRLGRLVDESLVELVPAADGEPRFRLLATLREYALELLAASGQAAEVEERFAGHFLELAEDAAPELVRAGQAAWLDRLERELDNLRGALRWFDAQGLSEGVCRLASALRRFWLARGRVPEGLGWLEAGLRGEGLSEDVEAEALLVGGLLASKSDPAHARELLERADAIAARAGDAKRRAQALSWLTFLARGRGELEAGAALGERAVGLARESGDQRLVAVALSELANTRHELGHTEDARALLREAAERFAGIGDRHNYAVALTNLGEYAALDGALAEAREALERSRAVADELGDHDLVAISLGYLGLVELCDGSPGQAAGLAREALAAVYELEDVGEVLAFLRVLASALAAGGEGALAARLWGAAEAAAAARGLAADSAPVPAGLAPAPGPALDDQAFARELAAGRALSLAEAVALASVPIADN